MDRVINFKSISSIIAISPKEPVSSVNHVYYSPSMKLPRGIVMYHHDTYLCRGVYMKLHGGLKFMCTHNLHE